MYCVSRAFSQGQKRLRNHSGPSIVKNFPTNILQSPAVLTGKADMAVRSPGITAVTELMAF